MKFFSNTAFLSSLPLAIVWGKESYASDIDMEDLAYWRDLVDAVDSFPPTDTPTMLPTKFPTSTPIVDPTDAPVVDPTDAPVVSTLPPSTAPVSSCQTIGKSRRKIF